MTLAGLVLLGLKASIGLLVFSIGLGTAPGELMYLVRHPGRMVRALLAMSLVMPIIALLAVKLLPMEKSVAITLVALSLSPVPPMLPRKMLKAGGGHAYVAALLFTSAALSVVWIRWPAPSSTEFSPPTSVCRRWPWRRWSWSPWLDR